MIETQLKFTKAVDGYLIAKEVEGKSRRTLEWYRRFLEHFAQWICERAGAEMLTQIQSGHVRSYLHYLRTEHMPYSTHRLKPASTSKGVSQRSVLAAFTALSAFSNWCVREGLLQTSFTANMRRPKLDKTIVPTFSREDVQALLRACDNSEFESLAARNRAIVLVLLDTGIRLGELLNMSVDRLNLSDSTATVMGKGSKERPIFFGTHARKALWQYVSLYRPEPCGNIKQVFLNADGTSMQDRRVGHLIKQLAKRAGVEDAHPHRFRHTAAVQFLRNGGNIFALQKMLGHTTLEMVRYYAELSREDVQKVHKTASPADNWNLK